MKYAHIEQERRYLPLGRVDEISPTRILHIQDRYVHGSTLRLRRVDEEGKPPVFKMGQKIRVGGEYPLKIAHTTLYLSESEFELLGGLTTTQLQKRRSIFYFGDWQISLDEFEDELAGLLLVEVDLGSSDAEHPSLPFRELIDVTHDERFSGGRLARTSSSDLQSVLTEYGVN